MSRVRRQLGAALLAMVAAVGLAASLVVVSRLDSLAQTRTASNRAYNAAVLARAKSALIGYVAAQAIRAGEQDPGALPCPEASGYYGVEASEGIAAGNCSTQRLGRYPWKTVGTEKFVDAAGEPLWYAVSSGWVKPNSTTNTTINSNSVGGLTVDGTTVVAVLLAPGAALNVGASGGYAAVSQARPASGTLTASNYLEYQNATVPPATLSATGLTGTFNDQLVVVTASELLPAIEAAIAARIEREIVPALESVYASTDWGANVSATQPVFPFAAAFANPSTSNYRGAAGTYAGLLPFSYTGATCGSDARCASSLHPWSTPTRAKTSGSAALNSTWSCTTTTSQANCYGYYYGGTIALSYEDSVSNIANALRTFTLSNYSYQLRVYDYDWGVWRTVSAPSASRRFNSDGSFSFVLDGSLPAVTGWAYYEYTTARPAFSDHALLSSTDATTGWFVRNEWYRLLYYVTAQGHTAGNTAPSCTTAVNCITVSNVTPSAAQRAILILAGRSVNGAARPSATLSDYLELGNAGGAYESRTVSPLALSGAPYTDTGTTNNYQISASTVTAGAPLYFRSSGTNTGAATLTTTGVSGARPIVNEDGSALSAGQIPANGIVQVTYNGTRFVLRKAPFNDRVIVVSSN